MKFTFSVDMGNDAFADTPMSELARIMRDVADKLERGDVDGNYVRDANGNTCGEYRFIRPRS